MITERTTHGGQSSAQVRDLKPSVRATISTEAAMRGFGMGRTKTVIGGGSQRATAQPEVKFTSSKLSMTLSADQNRLPPTNGGTQRGAFQAPQLANTQKQYLPSQCPNMTSNARDDYFIRSSLPKLKLAELSGHPLEWPEWSQLFQATFHAANMDDSVKLNNLKTIVTGKAKEAVAGLGYTAEMYNVAWNVLVRNFGKSLFVVNAQLKRLYSFPPIKPYDGAALIKNIVEVRDSFDTIQIRGRTELRSISRQCHKEVNTGHEIEEAHSSEANEPVSTWIRCVQ